MDTPVDSRHRQVQVRSACVKWVQEEREGTLSISKHRASCDCVDGWFYDWEDLNIALYKYSDYES
jgi:hypothetical protein